MKKILILFLVLLSMSGCTIRDDKYYLNIANTAIGFFRSLDYDTDDFHKDDMPAIKEYMSTISHIDQMVNVSKLASISETALSSKPNSSEIIMKDNMCYISYDVLKEKFEEFYKADDHSVIEVYHTVTCNGEYITLYEDMFYPDYEATKENPKFDYILYDYYEEDGNYYYIYRSSYDGTGLKMSLILNGKTLVKIETSEENIEWGEN